MTDSDPWAQASDPAVYRVSTPPASSLPPPGVYDGRRREQWPVALAVVAGAVAMALLLVIGLSVAIPVFLHQREKGERAAAADSRVDDDEGSRVADGVVDGDGYQYLLPIGWRDVTDRAREQPEGVVTDTATTWAPPGGGAPSSIIVEEGSVPGASLEQMVDAWRGNVSDGLPAGVPIEQGPDSTVAGTRAITMTVQDFGGEFGPMDLVCYLVATGDQFYAVAFMYPAAGDRDGGLLIERTLATWQWE